jgi:hypothetical protein
LRRRVRVAHAGLAKDTPDRPRADLDRLLLLGQTLGEVDRVEAGELARCKLDDAAARPLVDPVGWPPAPVGVDQRRAAVGSRPLNQPADLAPRKHQRRAVWGG